MFPESDPLQFVTIDVLGPLPKTTLERQYIAVITYRWLEVTSAVHNAKKNVSHI